MVHTCRVLGSHSPRLAAVVDDNEYPTIVTADLARRGSVPEGLAIPCSRCSRLFYRC